MITPGFVGSLAYRVIAWALVVAMTSTSSIPIIQRVRVAADAYTALMHRLGGLNPTLDTTSSTLDAITSALPTDLQDTFAPRHTLNAPRRTLSASRVTLDDSPPPLSVSRIQSTYTPVGLISGTLAVTFTIYNNRPPTLMPDVSESAAITEAVAALESFDATSDPNAVHHVLLVDSLTAHATYLSSEPRPDRVPYPF